MEIFITVAGMILAFLTAFFAEPVKTSFQGIRKREQLRLALYKELFNNYIQLTIPDVESLPGRFLLQTDCYNYAIKSEIAEFYKLREAMSINNLYKILGIVIDTPSILSKMMLVTNKSAVDDFESSPQKAKEIDNMQKNLSSTYVKAFANMVKSKKLTRRVIMKVVNKEGLAEILARAD